MAAPTTPAPANKKSMFSTAFAFTKKWLGRILMIAVALAVLVIGFKAYNYDYGTTPTPASTASVTPQPQGASPEVIRLREELEKADAKTKAAEAAMAKVLATPTQVTTPTAPATVAQPIQTADPEKVKLQEELKEAKAKIAEVKAAVDKAETERKIREELRAELAASLPKPAPQVAPEAAKADSDHDVWVARGPGPGSSPATADLKQVLKDLAFVARKKNPQSKDAQAFEDAAEGRSLDEGARNFLRHQLKNPSISTEAKRAIEGALSRYAA